jgi:hypothetical protein
MLEATSILENRGKSPRNYKNTLVFLAGDVTRLLELQRALRQFLAWKSIWDEKEQLNLDPFQSKQAETKKRNADDTVKARIPESYQWLIVPGQPDPKGSLEWTESRLQGADSLATRASKKLKNEELLLIQMGGIRLRLELDRVPLWRGEDVLVKQLIEDFATYLYLPRLRDPDVLMGAIREGISRLTWESETFAYAQGKDSQTGRYLGLDAGKMASIQAEGGSLLVESSVAARQLREDAQKADGTEGEKETTPEEGNGPSGEGGQTGEEPTGGGPTVPRKAYKRFYGAVQLDSLRVGRDAGRIADEVIQHLTKHVGAEVEVSLEIRARLSEGASDKTVRDVTENCRTLRFDTFGFEEE